MDVIGLFPAVLAGGDLLAGAQTGTGKTAGFVLPMQGVLIGIIAGGVCFWACTWLKLKVGYDDSLDVFGVHGVGGTWGALATGIFATKAVNDGGGNAPDTITVLRGRTAGFSAPVVLSGIFALVT